MPAPPQIAALGTNPAARSKAAGAEGLHSHEEPTDPGAKTPLLGAVGVPPPLPRAAGAPPPIPATPIPATPRPTTPRPVTPGPEEHSAILGIGTGAIGGRDGGVSGEIHRKIAPGQRVLVPGPNGLMQSATVRQLLQGYYELEVGSSGETIWVPISGVVPE